MMKLAGSNCETVMRWATWKMQCSYVEDPFRSSQGVLNHETSTIWRMNHPINIHDSESMNINGYIISVVNIKEHDNDKNH